MKNSLCNRSMLLASLSMIFLMLNTGCFKSSGKFSQSERPIDVVAADTKFMTGKHSGALYMDSGGKLQTFCSGTLIAPSVVLTAAHCLQFSAMMRLFSGHTTFYFGLNHLETNMSSAVQPVIEHVIHPLYVADAKFSEDETHVALLDWQRASLIDTCGTSGLTNDADSVDLWLNGPVTEDMLREEERWASCLNAWAEDLLGEKAWHKMHLIDTHDIAIAFLAEPIAGAIPAALPRSTQVAYHEHEHYTVAGYGSRAFVPDGPIELGRMHETDSFIIDASEHELLLNNGQISMCNGDSGGGVFSTGGLTPEIIGINARMAILPHSARCWGNAMATSTASHLPWIVDVLDHGLSRIWRQKS